MAADPRLPELYSDKDVAEYLGVAVYTVQDYVRKGVLGCIRRGKVRRYTIEHIRDFLASNEQPARREPQSRAVAVEGRATRNSPRTRRARA